MGESTVPQERVQLPAHVEPAVRDHLAEIAQANDRSMSAEIRRALAEHVARERSQGRSVAA